MIEIHKKDSQILYEMMLLDDRFRCTCDDVVREESFFQAGGHYHHCMLYQVHRAIQLSYRYFQNDPTLLNQVNVQNIICRNSISESSEKESE